ncbi:hypothetical protein Alsa3_CDS0197 [Staphylococcus phage Alsa_3]|nr:hypothetical protein Alsa2_CDS0081 [Staphylococcus phage Alsa_2]WNM51066.1 hypothetical protein Alsa3_CDS0197 [Staphylococcus phage Alsa_3]WNM51321.1 hypothetical protein Alsa4_CDS0191 [Staphylococcus phage Alsa_4]
MVTETILQDLRDRFNNLGLYADINTALGTKSNNLKVMHGFVIYKFWIQDNKIKIGVNELTIQESNVNSIVNLILSNINSKKAKV